jgi:hypothetical protein
MNTDGHGWEGNGKAEVAPKANIELESKRRPPGSKKTAGVRTQYFHW